MNSTLGKASRSANYPHPGAPTRSNTKQGQSKKARLQTTRYNIDSNLSSREDSGSTRKSRLQSNKLHQHCTIPATPRKSYLQVAKDQIILKGPEDLSEITPSDSTWRNHSAIQTEMSSFHNELLKKEHNIYDQGASQEALQDTVTIMQQYTEENKGNLLLMMDMLRQELHPNLLAPSLSPNSPAINTLTNSQLGRNQQNNEISLSPPSFPQPGEASQSGHAS